MIKIIFFITICFLNQIILVELKPVDTKLVLVQIVFRHGGRTPTFVYPNDTYNQSYWYKYGGLGQLTQGGIRSHYYYGQYLRKLYASFLDDSYNPYLVSVVSTDYDRTITSAQSLLAGLYTPVDFQIWNKFLLWQPIPVHVGKPEVFTKASVCPRFLQLLNIVLNSSEYLNANNSFSDLIALANNKSGLSDYSLSNISWQIGDTSLIENSFKLKLPNWIKNNLDRFQLSVDLLFYFGYRLPELALLQSGGLVNDMRKNINNKISGTSTKQLFLYSSHDSYLAALTKLLNVSTYINQPNFASSLTLELHQSLRNSSQYFVKVFLKNNTVLEKINRIELTINGCARPCPIADFMTITQNMIVTNFTAQCALGSTDNIVFDPSNMPTLIKKQNSIKPPYISWLTG